MKKPSSLVMHPMFVPLNQTLAASRGCESSAESICPIITMSRAVAISVVKVMMMVDISFFSIYVCLVLLFFVVETYGWCFYYAKRDRC